MPLNTLLQSCRDAYGTFHLGCFHRRRQSCEDLYSSSPDNAKDDYCHENVSILAPICTAPQATIRVKRRKTQLVRSVLFILHNFSRFWISPARFPFSLGRPAVENARQEERDVDAVVLLLAPATASDHLPTSHNQRTVDSKKRHINARTQVEWRED